MKKRVSFILVFVLLFSFYSKVSASELCSPDGYTILTLNGIFTDKNGAIENKDKLARKFNPTYNNEPLKVDYLYNATHLAGVGDLVDAIAQGVADKKSDYDLTEMLNDASQKVSTQKILLVGTSQGNFYANNFYNKVASQPGGVPSQSIGVYGVGSPADYVAGGGKYVTSDTDGIIAAIVGRFIKILPPNIHIPLQASDGNGHSFSDVYLKYQSDRIISDINDSLSKLEVNDEQDPQGPCISPPELSVIHKVEGVVLAVADPAASVVKSGVVSTYSVSSYISDSVRNVARAIGSGIRNATLAVGSILSGLSANVIDSLPDTNSLTTILPSVSDPAPTEDVPVLTDNVPLSNDSLNENQTTVNDVQLTDNLPLIENQISTQEETISPPEIIATKTEEPIVEDLTNKNLEVVTIPEILTKTETPVIYSGGGGGSPTPPDTTVPIITVVGDNPASVNLGSVYTDLGATATDDVDTTVNVITTGTVDIAIAGTYSITYTATDSAGNIATLVRVVNVVDPTVPDTTAPVITMNGNVTESVVINSSYTDAGATALDAVDGTRTIDVSGAVDTTLLGSYVITYTASDIAGNISTLTRTVNVISAPSGPSGGNENNRIIDSDTTFSPGEYNFDNLTITNNAKLTLDSNSSSSDLFKGVKINAVNITIDNGSSISADGKGYQDGPGIPAPTNYYAGASYGGAGVINESTSVYGSAKEPTDLGSGGTNAYRGGGAIKIVVTGTITNNGSVSSNGEATSSGGSIFVTANSLTGSGTFSTNGGGFYAGGNMYGAGGGGRIALYYKNSSFTGKTESLGGCGSTDGMTTTCAKNGTIGFFDSLNNDLYVDSLWVFQKNDSPFNFNHITLTNGSTVTTEKEVSITANDLLVDKVSVFTLAENQVIDIPSVSVTGRSTLTLSGNETLTINTLNVTGNSVVTIIPEKILSLTIPNITVASGSSINLDAKGFGQGTGPGAPPKIYDPNNPNPYFAGASYGGKGFHSSPESIYGSSTEPVDFGSAGNGNNSRGGGALRLIVTGNLINDGVISANGNGTSSGGSIYVTVNSLSGTGSFQTKGGWSYCSSSCYGPGGGGRIAIYYKTSSFTGSTIADGWSGDGGTSEVGTVHIVDESVPSNPPASSLKAITVFSLNELNPSVSGVIDENNHTVSLTVPFGTNIANLIPTINISDEASVVPNSDIPQNFTSSIVYTVTAENSSTQAYTVSVVVAPDLNPPADTTPPSVTKYDLNGYYSDITINPSQSNPTAFTIKTNEDVNWVSIKIEKEDDPSLYKIFQSGGGCEDGTKVCTKIWFGNMSSGGLVQNGRYRIKLHMKDLADNEFDDYLSPYVYVIKVD